MGFYETYGRNESEGLLPVDLGRIPALGAGRTTGPSRLQRE